MFEQTKYGVNVTIVLWFQFVWYCLVVDAKLLGEIPLKADWVPDNVEFSHPQFDVTGGMASKMARACSIAKSNIPVFVVGSTEEEIKLACKEGRTNDRGTKIFSIDSN